MEQVIYGPLELPSGRKICFREPLGSDRVNVLTMTQISADRAISDAMLVDDYVAAKCVTEVDGKPTSGDYKHLFAGWPQRDVLFYRAVFDEMFGMNEETRSRVKEAAAFLLGGRASTGGSS
jgi:hypothetical protein